MFATEKGVKYAVTGAPSQASGSIKLVNDGAAPVRPGPSDIVVIEYTGYLSDGRIFDATHAKGKGKDLAFQMGTSAVIPGLEDVVRNMRVGESVQAIVPPELGYPRGICLKKEDETEGECLVKPGATLVYDVFLKKTSIPPP
ncbi:hypothetical protein TeGR_g2740 [Tetraparma gracilis]|uniref:peptidylprolyl isomerase n=1 Tax=Tetraparma gracilis TaxID=2962635 RepID=A0ABQ6MCH9_9STRA|nr:hypothetical protein TeGR_g2740 [Tetraparma gracilis]